MPTANRRRFVPLALKTFLRQDYEPKELIVLDDGSDSVADLIPDDARIRYFRIAGGLSLGEKRNETCRRARGDILVNWDDDDWSAPWRLSYQVKELESARADICGLDRLWFYDAGRDSAWRYRYPGGKTPWLTGGTLCFRRNVWERHPFPDMTIGEDTHWIMTAISARVLPLARWDFYVVRIHGANTSPKHTDGPWCTRCDTAQVREFVSEDWSEFAGQNAPPQPLVSCILPTSGRQSFCALAIERFLAQDYPRKELIVVDDGPEPVADVVGSGANVQYIRLRNSNPIGKKRNIGCEAASGEIMVQWDDDDWYGTARLSRQVAPLIDDRADVTALEARWIASLPEAEFWTVSPRLHRRMFYWDVHPGTLAFTRAMRDSGVRYPEIALGEDVGFLENGLRAGARLLRVANDDLFVYMRHAGNTWSFPLGRHIDPNCWARTQAPAALHSELLSRYQAAARKRR